MRARHSLEDPSADIVGVRTPQGEELYMDRGKKLEQGCTVAVFLDSHFALVGQLARRPSVNRRLVIRCSDGRGNECITRIFGLKDKDTQVLRVVGVMTRIPIADEPEDAA